MLSEDCSIDECVQMVRGSEPWKVIELAVEEARVIFANKPWNDLPDDGACLYVDVGGGST